MRRKYHSILCDRHFVTSIDEETQVVQSGTLINSHGSLGAVKLGGIEPHPSMIWIHTIWILSIFVESELI